MSVTFAPAALMPWSPLIPCVPTRKDPTTTNVQTIGMCMEVGEGEARRKLACWVADKGWISENFVGTPVERIKGWLELSERLMDKVFQAKGEDRCDPVITWRAVTDTFAVVDRITLDKGVHWDQPMSNLYNAIKGKVVEISTALETDKKDAHGVYESYVAIDKAKPTIEGLMKSTNTTHSMINAKAGDIVLPPGVPVGQVAALVTAIVGAVITAITSPIVAKALVVLAVVAVAVIVVRFFNDIVQIVKGWF